jgi:hypothetical protein
MFFVTETFFKQNINTHTLQYFEIHMTDAQIPNSTNNWTVIS